MIEHKQTEDVVDVTSQEWEEFRSRWKPHAERENTTELTHSPTQDAMFFHIQEQIQAEQQKPHWFAWRTSVRYLSMLALVMTWVGLILSVKPRADLHQYPAPRMVLILALLGLGLLVQTWYLLRPLYKPAAPVWLSERLVPWVGLFLPLVLACWPLAAEWSTYNPATTAHMLKDTLICLILGIVFAAPLIGLGYRLSRHLSTGYLLLSGAMGGLFGNMLLQLFCPKSTLAHMILGHGILGMILLLVLYVSHKKLRKLGPSSL